MTDLPVPEPGAHEVRVKIEAAGVNFIDIYQRTGLYPVAPPFTPGMEGAGVIDAVGSGVTASGRRGRRFPGLLRKGLEPSRAKRPLAPQASVSTNSTTAADGASCLNARPSVNTDPPAAARRARRARGETPETPIPPCGAAAHPVRSCLHFERRGANHG